MPKPETVFCHACGRVQGYVPQAGRRRLIQMNISPFKPFQSLKNWSYVCFWALELYARIRHHGEVADHCLRSFLRHNRQIGSRNRRALGDLVFNTLRWDLAIDHFSRQFLASRPLTSDDLDAFRLAGGLILAMGEEAPPPEALAARLQLTEDAVAALHQLAVSRAGPDPILNTGLSGFLLQSLESQLGDGGSTALGHHLLQPGPIWLRLKTASLRDKLIASLAAQGIHCSPHPVLPMALKVENRAPLTRTLEFKRGTFWIQDLGSQLICELVELRPGLRILDACAGAGGKSLNLLSRAPDLASFEAWDVAAQRLERLHKRADTVGLGSVLSRQIEVNGPLPASAGSFDRILVDAPCSGSGTLARCPERRRRITPTVVENFAKLQLSILERFAPLCAKDGHLIYATCSFFAQENEDVVASFLAQQPDFRILPVQEIVGEPLSTAFGLGEQLRLWPHQHDCDGFFAAVLQKN